MIKNSDSIPFRQSPSLIVFGGTFDPPHAGHAACVRALTEQFPSSGIMIVPAADPPPTNAIKKTTWLPFKARLELCRAMVDDLGLSGRVRVSDIEGSLPQPSYTVNTLRELLAQGADESSPEAHLDNCKRPELAILIGGDQFANFSTWHEPELIVGMADLILVPRAGEAFVWPKGDIARKARVWTLNVQTPPASSSAIREAIHKKVPVPQGWLQPGVIACLEKITGKEIRTGESEKNQ